MYVDTTKYKPTITIYPGRFPWRIPAAPVVRPDPVKFPARDLPDYEWCGYCGERGCNCGALQIV